MENIIKKYPLDLTGKSPDNFISGEPHVLVDNGRDGMRVFVPNYGAFYTESMVVRDATGTAIKPNVDYIATFLHEEATQRSGLEVCGVVVVTNPNITSPVYMDYQVVGGDYAISTNSLEQVLQVLADDDRPVEWGNIIGKPHEYPAGGHLHALWELYGFEYLVTQLERIQQAILVGDQATFDEVRDYAHALYEDGKSYTDALELRFEDHKNDYGNPHNVTKAQVGLGNVDNFPSANIAEIETGTATNRFVTVAGLTHGIQHHVGDSFDSHVSDYGNPHNVTKAQVGLGNVDNFLTATQTEAEGGTRNDRFMTPFRTAQAITSQAGALLDQHIADNTNPHNVTKAHVGLGSVPNYPIASQAEAESATTNSRLMSPLRTRNAFGPLFDEYVTNGFRVRRTGTEARIDIDASPGNNDLAFISHRDYNDDNALFRFSVSDNATSGSGDRFEFGGGKEGTDWTYWLQLDSNTATFRNNVSAADVYIRSDRRLKTNIEKITGALDKVEQLNGYTYTLIDSNEASAGLIAQELEKIMPNSVKRYHNEAAGEERLTVQLAGPVGLLIEAVKELQQQVNECRQALAKE